MSLGRRHADRRRWPACLTTHFASPRGEKCRLVAIGEGEASHRPESSFPRGGMVGAVPGPAADPMSEDERLEMLRTATEAHADLKELTLRLRRWLTSKAPATKAAFKAEQELFRLRREASCSDSRSRVRNRRDGARSWVRCDAEARASISSACGAGRIAAASAEKSPRNHYRVPNTQVLYWSSSSLKTPLRASQREFFLRGQGFYSRAPACRVSVTIASARLRALILAFAKS